MNKCVGILLIISTAAWGSLQKDFSDLRNNGRNLLDPGAICEEVAVLEMQREFGPRFTVLSGIEYSDLDGVAGELDVVVFENMTSQVALIGEVKCWENLDHAIKKAQDQRQRFFQRINSNESLEFSLKNNRTLKLTKQQFKTDRFVTFAQKGAKAFGFDRELEFSLGEMMSLRDMIMKCQNSGACRKGLR